MAHIDSTQSINDKWQELATRTREEAYRLPPGRAQDAMMAKAQQLDTACHINEWISSPGLRPPVEVAHLTK